MPLSAEMATMCAMYSSMRVPPTHPSCRNLQKPTLRKNKHEYAFRAKDRDQEGHFSTYVKGLLAQHGLAHDSTCVACPLIHTPAHVCSNLRTVHYEYMPLANKTSVLREAMFLFVEPRCFGASKYVHIC